MADAPLSEVTASAPTPTDATTGGDDDTATLSAVLPDGAKADGAVDKLSEEAAAEKAAAKVLWLGSLLPRLLTTPNGSQRLPTAPCDYKHTLLLARNGSH